MSDKTTSQADKVIYAAIDYALQNQGEMTAMKLHKLLYYCQAWSLVWDEKPLFTQKITGDEAWTEQGSGVELTDQQKETIDAILDFYGPQDSLEPSRLTHLESTWKETREGIPLGERSDREIGHGLMAGTTLAWSSDQTAQIGIKNQPSPLSTLLKTEFSFSGALTAVFQKPTRQSTSPKEIMSKPKNGSRK